MDGLDARRDTRRSWFTWQLGAGSGWKRSAWALILLAFMVLFVFAFWPRRPGPPFELHFGMLLTLGAVTVIYLRPRYFRSWFAALFIIHLVAVIGSLLVARDSWVFSIMGNASRYDGLLSHLAIAAVAITAYSSFRRWPDLISITLKVYYGVVLFHTVVIMLQRFGFTPLSQLLMGSDRPMPPVGMTGNTGFLAGLILPAVILLFVQTTSDGNQRNRILAVAALAFVALGLGLTDNKASFYALAFVLAGIVLFRFRLRTVLLAALVMAVIFAGRLWIPDQYRVQGTYDPRRSAGGRVLIWTATLEAVRNTPGQPFVGGGPDAMELAQYREYVDPLTLIPFFLRCCWTKAEFFEEGEF